MIRYIFECITIGNQYFAGKFKMQKKSNVRKWIACIEAYDEDSAKDLAERMTKIFPGALASTGKNRMKWKNPKKKQSIAWR